MIDLIEGELKYPIYSFSFRWDQDDSQDDYVGFSEMFRFEMTPDELNSYADTWWNEFIIRPRKSSGIIIADKNPVLKLIGAKYVEHETWCGGWFQHYTLNTHLTDEELHLSFSRFVMRKQDLIYAAGGQYSNNVPYCLMGAEDTYRWKGPCRCEHCVKLGRVVIDH